MAASDRLSELDSTGECSYSTNSKQSVLDRLKCPEASVYARKQKVKTNPPVGVKLFTKPHLHPEIYHTDVTSEGVVHCCVCYICSPCSGNIDLP